MKTVYIVTGANGFLGNNIVRILSNRENSEIRVFLLKNTSEEAIKNLNCKIYFGDILDKKSLDNLFAGIENEKIVIIHCAAMVSIKSTHKQKMYDVNVVGTKNIVNYALRYNAKLVYVSSVHAIEEKSNNELITETKDFDEIKCIGDYAKTKATAAKYVMDCVKNKNLDACILHPSGMIGPNDYSMTHLTRLIVDTISGRLKSYVEGGYDFVDVRDVALGVVNACDIGERGECYLLTNRYIKIKELLDIITNIKNKEPISLKIPYFLAQKTAYLAEKYYELINKPPLYTPYSIYTLKSNANFLNEYAIEKLGYSTRDIEETIRDTITWLENEKIV